MAEMLLLPLVEPAMPVVCPARLQLPRGALGSFEGASLAWTSRFPRPTRERVGVRAGRAQH